MNRRLFEDLVASTAAHRRRNDLVWPASLALHVGLVAAALAAFAMTPASLPEPPPTVGLPLSVALATPAPVEPTPRPDHRGPRGTGRAGAPPPAPSKVAGEEIVAPPEPGNDADSPAVCLADCGAGFVVDPGPAGTGAPAGGGMSRAGPVRAGIHVAPPRRLRDVTPIYPELARRVGAQGVVVIECQIDEAGRVVEAQVVRSQPLLDAAALEAVEQWLYTPTLLNGVPVSVVMSVSVRFTLARP